MRLIRRFCGHVSFILELDDGRRIEIDGKQAVDVDLFLEREGLLYSFYAAWEGGFNKCAVQHYGPDIARRVLEVLGVGRASVL